MASTLGYMERARITFARASGLAVIAVVGALALPAGGHAATAATGSSLGDMYTPWVPGSPGQSGGQSSQPPTVGPGAQRAASPSAGGTGGQPASVRAAAQQINLLARQGQLPRGVATPGVGSTMRQLSAAQTRFAEQAPAASPASSGFSTGWLFLALVAVGCGFVLRPRGSVSR
jgi:hypothetical protein